MDSPNGDWKQQVREHWERETCGVRYGRSDDRETYFGEIYRSRYEGTRYLREFARFDEARGKRVLEIGVGAGSDFRSWVENGARGAGIDLTEGAIRLTAEHLRGKGLDRKEHDLQTADAEQLPFEDGTFDIVYSYGVLHTTPDTEAALAETHRVLKPGGELRAMVYHVPSWTGFIWVRYGLLAARPFLSQKQVIFKQLGEPGHQGVHSRGSEGVGPVCRVPRCFRRVQALSGRFSEHTSQRALPWVAVPCRLAPASALAGGAAGRPVRAQPVGQGSEAVRSPPGAGNPGPRLLLVGPRVVEDDVVGGTQILFEQTVEALRRRARVGLKVVSTARPLAGRGRVGKVLLDAAALTRTLSRVWSRAVSADLVVWCVSPRAALLSGWLVWLACALRGLPLCVRFFGGNFDAELARAPRTCRFLAARTFLKADHLLFETRRLAEKFGEVFQAVWLPTTRDMPRRRRAYRSSCRRLLFLSLLQPEKGLPELVAAAPRFPTGVRLSVYGPVCGFDPAAVDRLANAAYGGIVPPERVPEVMEAHDALVLPSRYSGEGYPGVVIEAFQMGLPVMVAQRPPLDELVTEGDDGVFVDPGSADSLVDAVTRLCADDALFQRLREGALRSGERYRNDRAVQVIEDLCRRAASGRAK